MADLFPPADREKERKGKESLYFSRQSILSDCLLHAINNLLQTEAFTTLQLNDIADCIQPFSSSLQLWTPHRVKLFGSYDVNVLLKAVETKGIDISYYKQSDKDCVELPASQKLIGFIANVEGTLFRQNHWLAIICHDGYWYVLDSKLAEPFLIEEDHAGSVPIMFNRMRDDGRRYTFFKCLSVKEE